MQGAAAPAGSELCTYYLAMASTDELKTGIDCVHTNAHCLVDDAEYLLPHQLSRAGNAGVEGRDGSVEGTDQSRGVQGAGRPGAGKAAQ